MQLSSEALRATLRAARFPAVLEVRWLLREQGSSVVAPVEAAANEVAISCASWADAEALLQPLVAAAAVAASAPPRQSFTSTAVAAPALLQRRGDLGTELASTPLASRSAGTRSATPTTSRHRAVTPPRSAIAATSSADAAAPRRPTTPRRVQGGDLLCDRDSGDRRHNSGRHDIGFTSPNGCSIGTRGHNSGVDGEAAPAVSAADRAATFSNALAPTTSGNATEVPTAALSATSPGVFSARSATSQFPFPTKVFGSSANGVRSPEDGTLGSSPSPARGRGLADAPASASGLLETLSARCARSSSTGASRASARSDANSGALANLELVKMRAMRQKYGFPLKNSAADFDFSARAGGGFTCLDAAQYVSNGSANGAERALAVPAEVAPHLTCAAVEAASLGRECLAKPSPPATCGSLGDKVPFTAHWTVSPALSRIRAMRREGLIGGAAALAVSATNGHASPSTPRAEALAWRVGAERVGEMAEKAVVAAANQRATSQNAVSLWLR
eukprot:TRINITY_DN14358_c0_g1_i2.p1 TRINITY_DN14358_c0_g1~~TRINITY_DN14358_c0_g1_i2.p1  ORF type:complete len:505 (+),score=82.76 TRINITY_DN14358_c0_g1_i2:56-1570(+)